MRWRRTGGRRGLARSLLELLRQMETRVLDVVAGDEDERARDTNHHSTEH